jgi:glycosyltransferase involved in cell wall biosynthesis
MDHYPGLRHKPASVFHEFIPMAKVSRQPGGREPFVFFLGAPWFLKGVDFVIQAFHRLTGDFPGVKLRLQGHFTAADRIEMERLIDGNPAIEILKAEPNPQTLARMGQALLFVLPSRCEGLPRVILEAMGAGIATIGSTAGGIPFLVRDGETGFVVPVGDAGALEARLRELLADPDLREKMGNRAYEIAHTELTEQVYRREFAAMVDAVVQGGA